MAIPTNPMAMSHNVSPDCPSSTASGMPMAGSDEHEAELQDDRVVDPLREQRVIAGDLAVSSVLVPRPTTSVKKPTNDAA